MNLLEVCRIVDGALVEDIGAGDVTTDSVIPREATARGQLIAKSAGVVAGIPVAALCFRRLDARVEFEQLVEDGARVSRNCGLARLSGPAASILTAERTAVNFLQRLSGIATLTAKFVDAVQDYPVRILDTRKTTPGFRVLEKYAVRMGGGHNHRLGLYDGILIKDNHLRLQDASGPGDGAKSVKMAVAAAKRAAGHLRRTEVEAENLEQVGAAVEAGADAILLDNMDIDTLAAAVEIVRKSGQPILLEASGSVSLRTVRAIAATGVDAISVGALTHSARALDMSLELEPG